MINDILDSVMHRLMFVSRRRPVRALLAAAALGAVAMAPGAAFAAGSVKVECNSNCSRVTLAQVCDTFSSGSVPIAVACEAVATPGSGSRLVCGSGAVCTSFGTLIRSDLLSAYCGDTDGNDVVVTCARNAVALVDETAEDDQEKVDANTEEGNEPQ